MKGPQQQFTAHWLQSSQSILNGIIGDYLAASNNPLAIQMGLYHQGREIDLKQDLVSQLNIPISNKVVLFIHGLTNLETIWDFPQPTTSSEKTQLKCDNYGTRLHEAYGYTPLFVRYNTGLSIDENGRALSELLCNLRARYPIKIEELILVGFSMGGLLMRQAQRYAKQDESSWLSSLSHCFYLGTPHEGSPLEKVGDLISRTVRTIPLDYVNLWADWIDVRSTGINNLKHGLRHLQDAEHTSDSGFYHQARHIFFGACIGSNQDNLLSQAFGDTLVRAGSALPSSAPSDSHSEMLEGMNHIQLAHSEEVYEHLSSLLEIEPIKLGALEQFPKDTEKSLPNESIPRKNDKKALLDGILMLASDGYQNVLKTTETMHQSIAKEPYRVLNQIPVVKEISTPIETIQQSVTELIYDGLKIFGKASPHNKEKR